MNTTFKWHSASFEELSTKSLHDLLQLRVAVFVVEQDCPYQEVDGQDKRARHVFATSDEQIVACLRILPPDSEGRVAIGRVVVAKEARGRALGHLLMKKGMDEAERLFGKKVIKISAQEHLSDYYAQHRFAQSGQGYLEDGIPHIPMERPASE